MLITGLLPLLSCYSLGFDLIAGPDGTVTVTVLPRKSEGSKVAVEPVEVRPISITGTAAEIDAELAQGADGALGQLIVARKGLADQLAEQRSAAEDAKAKTAKPKPAEKPAAKSAPSEKAATPPPPPPQSPPPAEPKPGEPASLW